MGIRLAEGVETFAVADDAVDGIGEGVFHKQVYHHIAVAARHCLMTEHEIFGHGMIHTLVAEHFACADCIVTLGAESVVDVKMYHHIAVTVAHRLVEICDNSVVQQRIGRTEIHESVVGESVAATYSVETGGTESVFHPEVYNHIAVAAVVCGMYIQVGTRGIESSIGIHKGMTGTYRVVTVVVEGVLDIEVNHHIAVAAFGIQVSENEVLGQRMGNAFVSEHTSGTDSVVAMSAYGVVDVQADKHGAVAAFDGGVPVGYHRIVQRWIGRKVVEQAVVSEGVAATDGVVTPCAESVVYREYYYEVVTTAVGFAQTLGIYAGCRVRPVALTAVGIEHLSGTDNRTYGVTQSVEHRNIDYKIVETAVGISQILRINACITVRYIVGIERGAGKKCSVNSVAEGVVHRYFDDKVVETAVLTAVLIFVHSPLTVAVAKGVETASGTDGAAHGVADGVEDKEIDMQYAVATRCRMQVLTIVARQGVGLVVHNIARTGTNSMADGRAYGVGHSYHNGKYAVAATRRFQFLAVGAGCCVHAVVYRITAACADGVVNDAPKGVANGYVDVQYAVAPRCRMQVLTVASRQGVSLAVYDIARAGTNCLAYGRAYGVGYGYDNGKYAVAALWCLQFLSVYACGGVNVIVYRRAAACADGIVNGVAQGVVHRKVDNEIVQASRRGIHKILGVKTFVVVRRVIAAAHRKVAHISVGVETGSGTHVVVYGVAQGVGIDGREHHCIHKNIAAVRGIHAHRNHERSVGTPVGIVHRVAFKDTASVAEIPQHAVVSILHFRSELDATSRIEIVLHMDIADTHAIHSHVDRT